LIGPEISYTALDRKRCAKRKAVSNSIAEWNRLNIFKVNYSNYRHVIHSPTPSTHPPDKYAKYSENPDTRSFGTQNSA
jgi:hypothetical protein